MTIKMELVQNRNLIRTNFDGYKLSLDSVPIHRQDLINSAPFKAQPNNDQYTFLHVKLYTMQNLLFQDPWRRTCVYFINNSGEIVQCTYDDNTRRPNVQQVVFRFNADTSQHSIGDYNYTCRFISQKYCIICDGKHELFLFDTGDRIKSHEWKQVCRTHLQDNEGEKYLIYDCRLDIVDEQKEISIIVGGIRHQVIDGVKKQCLELDWCKWISKDTWEFSILDKLRGTGSIHYCAFEPRAQALIISSNQKFHFCSEISSNENEQTHIEGEERPQFHDKSNETFHYSWSQTNEDIIVKFNTIENMENSGYNIKSTSNELDVKYKGKELINGTLFGRIDGDLTTWIMENNCLQVTLVKQLPLLWSSLLENDSGPKENTENDQVPLEEKSIVDLQAQIEDCDFTLSSRDSIKIRRFCLSTKTLTHTIRLGTTEPLFSTTLRSGFPAAIVTREDVDASIWLQQYNASNPSDWTFRHEGNLHAFGYVQASKRDKKFMDCSPDLNYAVICESNRHLFLYRMNNDSGNGLRNRNGPQVTLGKQQLITLKDVGEVLGLATDENVIIILSEKAVLYLQIN